MQVNIISGDEQLNNIKKTVKRGKSKPKAPKADLNIGSRINYAKSSYLPKRFRITKKQDTKKASPKREEALSHIGSDKNALSTT